MNHVFYSTCIRFGCFFTYSYKDKELLYWTHFNCSAVITASVWNGAAWLDLDPMAQENHFGKLYEALSKAVCSRFDAAPSAESVLFYIIT